ncbi:MAG: DUF2723 domain-containing protein [Candidatus Eisenbacteria bacterium]|nr:DUF2723 domain-containing protein [Candidatus Eisenbacteria bacterium]
MNARAAKRTKGVRAPAAPALSAAEARAPVPPLWSAGVGLAALAIYLALAPPVSADRDTAEFTLVLATLGVAHPTGYPLYTMLGHGFVSLLHAPGATWAFGANAWSALGGAVAMAFLHAFAARLAPPAARSSRRARFVIGLLPVALLGLNASWTSETCFAEVYSWHLAWVCGAALYFAWLVRALHARDGEWPARRLHAHAAGWGFLCGLGGAHHVTAILVAAPLSLGLLVALAALRKLRWTLLPALLAATLVPLASYGYLYWRAFHPAPVQWPLLTPSLASVLQHATGGQYRRFFGHFAPSVEQQVELARWVYPVLFPGLLLLLVAALLARGRGGRTLAGSLFAAATIVTLYGFSYGVADPASYFLPAMALGLAALAPPGGALAAASRGAARAAGAAFAVLALALAWPGIGKGLERRSGFITYDRLLHSMWMAVPADSGFLLWADDMYYRLYEYQLLRHEKPRLYVDNPLSLMNAEASARFARRFGFDPMAGLPPPPFSVGTFPGDTAMTHYIDEFGQSINRRTALPVVMFEPQRARFRVLPKASTSP